jgi:hypothetical protein
MHALCGARESAGETPLRLSWLSGWQSTASPTSSSPQARSPGIHCRHRGRDMHAASVPPCSRSPCSQPANWRPVPSSLPPICRRGIERLQAEMVLSGYLRCRLSPVAFVASL